MQFWFGAITIPHMSRTVRAGPRIAQLQDMADDAALDYYEILQISATAETETIHRVYRLLAQRYHPDNADTGSPERFRQLTEAYNVLGDPGERARYDVVYERQRQARWRMARFSANADADFDTEAQLRVAVLEVLSTKRRTDPNQPAMYQSELEQL